MPINVNEIEIGEGSLQVLVFPEPTGKFWDDGTTWGTEDHWPYEYEVGASLGAHFQYRQLYKDIEVGQVLAPVKAEKVGEEGSFRITMMESTLANICLSLGLDPQEAISGDTIYFGDERDVPWFTLVYLVPQTADSSKEDRLELFRVVPTSGVALPFSKGEERKWEVTFELKPDGEKDYTIGRLKRP